MHLVRGLSVVWLAVAVCQAATELVSDGTTLFRATANVTFGAVYTERAAKVTVVSAVPTAVSIRTGKAPRNVFVGDERLAPGAWVFEAQTGSVTLEVPAGTTSLQLRFDDLDTLKPVTVSIPVALVLADGTVSEAGRMEVTLAAEFACGSLSWPGPEGIFSVRALRGGQEVAGVRVSAANAGPVDTSLLLAGTTLTLAGDAPGQTAPVERIECRLLGVVAASRRVDKATLAWDSSTVVEAEAFKAEGGGTVSRSTEHGNTHGGGCIFAWAAAGHWLAWDLAVPADGHYVLTLVGATQEKEALRAVAVDGQALPGAGAIRFEGTGGWGRSKAEEWQAVQPVDGQGNPLRIALTAGNHEIRLTNLFGQHMNLDCLLLTPVP
jgi:hypothetical protein